MAPTTALSTIIVAILAVLVLVGSIWVVTLRNLFRAALSLGLVLTGVAGLFLVLEAEFLAFVQILVYVGAILTLIVFAIMLTAKLHTPMEGSVSRQRVPAAIVSLGLFILLSFITQSIVWPHVPFGEAISLAALGQQLITTLVLPFEVISLVFVAAIVGAVAIAAERKMKAPSE